LGESQPKGTRISAPRFNQAHAQKTMQSRMISPDRLLQRGQPERGAQRRRPMVRTRIAAHVTMLK
jgi:hypothetical protein